jgi:1-acyl-sn-glycerol-3-phosphate acyltransferase
VLIFPEGTRSRSGDLGAFHRGAALLAIDAGVPVVPVAISGVHDVLAPGAALPHPGRCGVCVGEPITTGGETVESLTALIELRIRALRDAAAAVVEA